MSTTELITAKDILEDLRDKFGIEDETWVSSYAKTAQSKNITIQEWNRVVKKVSANSSSTEALYTALEDSLALFGNLKEKENTFDTRISNNKTAIEDEVKRAKAREADLKIKIDTEADRAKSRENSLSGRIDINESAISTNTTDIGKNADDIEKLAGLITDLQNFDTTHKKEFDDFVDAVNDLLDMDDESLDTYQEVLALIKSNRDSLSLLGTSKIDKTKIVDNLKTALADHVLSANQGVILKNLITALENALNTEVTNRESAVTSEENARKRAIIEEANARSLADATHTAGIAALNTRLDSLDLPLIQHPLYEHNLYVNMPYGTYPRLRFKCTIFNDSASEMGTLEVFNYLRDNCTDGSIIVKNFHGYLEHDVDGVILSNPVTTMMFRGLTLPTAIVFYLDWDGVSAQVQVDYSTATVDDAVIPIANVAENAGGGGNAIIECLELPTQNKSTTHFYRTPDGKIHWYDGVSWYSAADGIEFQAISEAFEDVPISVPYTADVKDLSSAYNVGIFNRIGIVPNVQFTENDLANSTFTVDYRDEHDTSIVKTYTFSELTVVEALTDLDGNIVGHRYTVPALDIRYAPAEVVILTTSGLCANVVANASVTGPAVYLGRTLKDVAIGGGYTSYSTEVASVSFVTYIKKIKPERLPEGVGSGGVSSWNDLTDKPFGEEATETFSASNKPHREMGGVFSMGTYGLVTDTVVPAVDELGSYSADVTFIYGEAQNTESVTYVLSEFVVENLNGGYKLTKRSPVNTPDAIVFVVSDYATFIANYALEVERNGIYAYSTERDYSTPSYTSFANVTAIHKTETKTLDEKYIPDTIARVSDIPEGGSLVQIIRWEAND